MSNNLNLISLNKSATMQKWAQKIMQCRNSGLSVTAWCRENHISTGSYYVWQKKLFQVATSEIKTTSTEFAELPLPVPIGAPQMASDEAVAVLETNGITVKLFSTANTKTIQAICRGLRQC